VPEEVPKTAASSCDVFETDFMESSILTHSGSNLIKERVFDEILKAEGETHKKEDKQQVDITPRNYDFTFAGQESCNERPCYRLGISPKRKDKYSVIGDIWIDAEDFAIVRLYGQPAKRPSFWTLKTEIRLTDRLDSSSDIFIAGRSILSIEYDYETVDTEYLDGLQ